ncbi:hypothetical protein BC828DRAFT_407264 [Blastocladiella britannica]|nr:hypothetical protein BC828DRAFT_407264 [Blastocladiella britannica]
MASQHDRSILAPLPLITHVFRDESHPSHPVLATLFTVLLVVPPVVLSGSLMVALRHSPKRTTLASAGLVAALAMYLGLALIYWFGLSLLQTLPLAAVLSAVAVPVGAKALRLHAA